MWNSAQLISALPTAAASSQDITLPHIPELYDPDYLEALLPADPLPSANSPLPATQNSFMNAFKVTSHQVYTENMHPRRGRKGTILQSVELSLQKPPSHCHRRGHTAPPARSQGIRVTRPRVGWRLEAPRRSARPPS
ncbi:hypothetical protein BV25DRAFT_345888 [Artomyces pyxidatus]|uniref:Uncharacterized protein n=1 Tax=Artomyces pyxidatus TaxID=48021 RepID=A0ACB8T7M8_9AGAM|nr:hypothetical protein BV25DRAFT_345888 [Artomyces pyxidatus]